MTSNEKCRILHLSDLHIGADHGFLLPGEKPVHGTKEYDFVDCIYNDLISFGVSRIDGVVISGDITTYGRWIDYREDAVKLFRKLSERLNVGIERFFIVPGNHDYEWYERDPQGQFARITQETGKAPSLGIGYPHVTHYRQFLRDFYGERDDLISRRVRTFEAQGFCFQIGLLDSCEITATDRHEYGYVRPDLLNDVAEEMSRKSKDGIPIVKILVLHHHVTAVLRCERLEQREVSITLNAGEVIERALECNAHFILHGHQHFPTVTKINRCYELEGVYRSGSRDIYVVSAGSVGVEGKRLNAGVPNTYTILTFDGTEVDIDFRRIRAASGPWGSLFQHRVTWTDE